MTPSNVGSARTCSTTAMVPLSASIGTDRMSRPSSSSLPLTIGIIPARASTVVDLPLPERPTKPHELPPVMVTLSPRRAGLGASQVYEAVRSMNSTRPRAGQLGGGCLAWATVTWIAGDCLSGPSSRGREGGDPVISAVHVFSLTTCWQGGHSTVAIRRRHGQGPRQREYEK